MNAWGWQPKRFDGVWRYGSPALKPLVAAAPYVTVLMLLVMFYLISGSFTSAKGMLFDLPEGAVADESVTELTVLVMPTAKSTLIFFDDSRYQLEDVGSLTIFAENLAKRIESSKSKSLLVLADRRVSLEGLAKLAEVSRRSGVEKVLFAEKRQGGER